MRSTCSAPRTATAPSGSWRPGDVRVRRRTRSPRGFVHIAPKATVTINFERRIDEFLWRYLAPVPIKSS